MVAFADVGRGCCFATDGPVLQSLPCERNSSVDPQSLSRAGIRSAGRTSPSVTRAVLRGRRLRFLRPVARAGSSA